MNILQEWQGICILNRNSFSCILLFFFYVVRCKHKSFEGDSKLVTIFCMLLWVPNMSFTYLHFDSKSCDKDVLLSFSYYDNGCEKNSCASFVMGILSKFKALEGGVSHTFKKNLQSDSGNK